MASPPTTPAPLQAAYVYALDMGGERYGDCVVCRVASRTILIDGGHPGDYRGRGDLASIPDQLQEILGHAPPFNVDLLVVTHVHRDHIGCLPTLVERGQLSATWALVADEKIGFGRAGVAEDASRNVPAQPESRLGMLIAALREESFADERDDAELWRFLSDAETLEARYEAMLGRLTDQGTRLVRYGLDGFSALEAEFRDVGLRILGPSLDHLLICSSAVARASQRLVPAVRNALSADAGADEMTIYRSLASAATTATDAGAADGASPGAAINNQSIVLKLRAAGQNILLMGDMQLAKAQVSGLEESMTRLRADIAQEGPYALVKLAHHSSDNGLDETVLREWGEGLCLIHSGGFNDVKHPDAEVLELLRRSPLVEHWARTDRNGLVVARLDRSGVRLGPSRGQLDDVRANMQDVGGPPGGSSLAPPPSTVSTPAPPMPPLPDRPAEFVEVTARIPHTSTKVIITVEVCPRSDDAAGGVRVLTASPANQPGTVGDVTPLPELKVACGRDVSSLLFVTSRDSLARTIGPRQADHLLGSLRAANAPLVDTLPAGLADAAQAAAQVATVVRRDGRRCKGVVLLGGYGVVPAQRLDVLDPDLRRRLPSGRGDADRFIVWSDDVYGRLDQDGGMDLPVSRIPDAGEGSADFMFRAIQAPGGNPQGGRFGIRNFHRPFANDVFPLLAGQSELLVSETIGPGDLRPDHLAVDGIYLMLHGADEDGRTFWGETRTQVICDAIDVGNVESAVGATVFTGCCWGALCVDSPAVSVRAGDVPRSRTPTSSLALKFLQAGARAFVGCTGSHYSPIDPPLTYFGQPLHRAFWANYARGLSPAESLFNAKKEYLAGIPHGRREAQSIAIEKKIWCQYTCLGLGW